MMKKESKIFIVGHGDIIEQSLLKTLRAKGFLKVISSSEIALDTTIQSGVYQFFSQERPEYVFLTSVRSGGIDVNQKNPAEFFYANSESQNNVVYAAQKFGVKKLMYVASSCVYPKEAPQPMSPESLMTGPLEKTSASYAMAKLAGIELCQAFRKQYNFNAVIVIPATVYGPQADVCLETAHVMGALIEKFFKAKITHQSQVVVWGTGQPKREFLFSEDFADACLFLMEREQGQEIMNIGSGEDISIEGLACAIKDVSGFSGNIVFDKTKPDGAMRKLLDSHGILKLGWSPKVSMKEGVQRTWDWYAQEQRKEKET
jgi:GDP-L-fucose synthase